jgi:hypothetical protein
VLGSYIKQKMRFFVAKVNLDHMPLLANGYLRALQVRYETAKFMLPLRLGTVNANGPQDLIVYALTRSSRVETEQSLVALFPPIDRLGSKQTTLDPGRSGCQLS